MLAICYMLTGLVYWIIADPQLGDLGIIITGLSTLIFGGMLATYTVLSRDDRQEELGSSSIQSMHACAGAYLVGDVFEFFTCLISCMLLLSYALPIEDLLQVWELLNTPRR